MATQKELVARMRSRTSAPEQRAETTSFSVREGDVVIHVAYYPGSAQHTVLTTPYLGRALDAEGYRGTPDGLTVPRPMEITLRRETSSDVRAKRSGVAIEAQTGDVAFDEQVYVESPSEPVVIQQVLASPALRGSVRALIGAGIDHLTIDALGEKIALRIDDASGLPDDETFLLRHLATIASHVPRARSTGARPLGDPWLGRQILLGVAAVLGALPAMFSMFMLLPDRCYGSDGDGGTSLACSVAHCCDPASYGAGGGAVVGLVVAAFLWTRVRGTSRAHRARPWVALFALLLALEAGLVVAHVAGALALRLLGER
jgi:hypothetical protein